MGNSTSIADTATHHRALVPDIRRTSGMIDWGWDGMRERSKDTYDRQRYTVFSSTDHPCPDDAATGRAVGATLRLDPGANGSARAPERRESAGDQDAGPWAACGVAWVESLACCQKKARVSQNKTTRQPANLSKQHNDNDNDAMTTGAAPSTETTRHHEQAMKSEIGRSKDGVRPGVQVSRVSVSGFGLFSVYVGVCFVLLEALVFVKANHSPGYVGYMMRAACFCASASQNRKTKHGQKPEAQTRIYKKQEDGQCQKRCALGCRSSLCPQSKVFNTV